MVTRKNFGRTWWGNAWIEAMARIDHDTNRLPRGRSYANGGRVQEIQICNGIVEAKVKGRQRKPYQVTIYLQKFTPEQFAKIQSCIAEDPALASELALGKLPQEMLDRLAQGKIFLLPTTWQELNANCSCPDWANPCKHLAAVYYLIANEVDKNPFILFHLRGVETNTLMQAAGFVEPAVAAENEETFIPYTQIKVPIKDNKVEPEFSSILSSLSQEKDSGAIFTLLEESPLFYPEGNFKQILFKAYHNIANHIKQLQLLEEFPSWSKSNICLLDSGPKVYHPLSETSFFIFLPKKIPEGLEGPSKIITVPEALDGKLVLKRKKGILLPAATLIDYFIRLPLQLSSEESSPEVKLISIATTIALALARASAFVPQIRNDQKGNFFVRYIPLNQLKVTEKALDFLAALIPATFLYQKEEKSLLMGRDAARSLLSLILTYIVHRFAGIKESNKLCNTFFNGDYYLIQDFTEKQTARVITNWLSILNLSGNEISPAIRIEIPPEKKTHFQLQVEVENKKDPLSPLIPLADVFTAKKTVFSHPVEMVRFTVAYQISTASTYFPPLKTVLSSKGKKSPLIDPLEMARFIQNGQHIFNMLGIRVIVPKELKILSSPQLSLAAKLKAGEKQNISYFNLEEMLTFSWEVALGDLKLTQKEFLQLVKSAAGVVKFKEHYLLLQPEEVARIVKKLNQPLPKLSSAEIMQASLTGQTANIFFHSDDKLRKMIDELTRFKLVKLPKSLKAVLRPYQKRGFQWLYSNADKGLGSCLADDMGLGKTIQAITLILKLKEEKKLDHPALVICPTTLVGNWLKECNKFAPSLKALTYHGPERQLITAHADLVITTYGLLRREVEKFKKRNWNLIIIDEAQNIKNADSKQTKTVKALKGSGSIALSGTPVENRLSELWSIFDYLNPGYLGTRQNFLRHFAMPIEKYRDQRKIALLQKATAPFIMRRMKTDRSIIQDLPDKIVKNEYCYLSKEQTAIYQRVVDTNIQEISNSEGIARRGLVFKLMTSLKQICNHPVHYTKKGTVVKEHSGKAEMAISLLEKIVSAREKVLLFTQYKEMGNLLVQLIQTELRIAPLFFHGSLTRKKREIMIEDFQNGNVSPIMIISLKAGGTGLNLTAATNVIHYDLWWNPAVEAQATDRTYRIGQSRKVVVHRLITIGTFEEKIDEMISAKKELAELTVSTGEKWLSELSNQELKEIFKLS
ncbi:MAG: DEAD/DEAH box helicase family protein [Actinobacteria bacterium]|nr:DEAD/DEAH box helicase family protein [Actinomycetota bacterium]